MAGKLFIQQIFIECLLESGTSTGSEDTPGKKRLKTSRPHGAYILADYKYMINKATNHIICIKLQIKPVRGIRSAEWEKLVFKQGVNLGLVEK